MKLFLLIGLLCIPSMNGIAAISLTEEQWENRELIHDALKKKDSNFVGFNGSREALEIIGMSEADAVKVIKKLDIVAAQEESPKKKKLKALKDKFIAAGFDDEMLEFIGFKGGE